MSFGAQRLCFVSLDSIVGAIYDLGTRSKPKQQNRSGSGSGLQSRLGLGLGPGSGSRSRSGSGSGSGSGLGSGLGQGTKHPPNQHSSSVNDTWPCDKFRHPRNLVISNGMWPGGAGIF